MGISLGIAISYFILCYLWSILEYSTWQTILQLDTVVESHKIPFAEFSLATLESGNLIATYQNQLQYTFSSTELFMLLGIANAGKWLLIGVVALGFALALCKAYRRYALLLIVLAGVLLSSPVLYWRELGIANPWWELLRISSVLFGLLIARRYLGFSLSSVKPALLAYASQTGTAKRLAEQLQSAAQHMLDVRCVSDLSVTQLNTYERVFFVVSTYGNGEAPDTAQRFVKNVDQGPSAQTSVQFSVLALGDRTYQTFCAFGHSLAALLEKKGYQPTLPTHEVDRMDLSSVESWWQQVCDVQGIHTDAVSFSYDSFAVVSNTCLNIGNPSRPAHHIRLQSSEARYQVGDILAVKPAQHPERLYSIASCESGFVDLLVRQHRREDGSIGVASGYLCQLQSGDHVQASIRSHETFHLVGDVPLIMIGAGTGLAPFIGFLKQKQAWQSQCEHWLLFGEQYAEHDAYFAEVLQQLQVEGVLTQLDYAWSRSEQVYIQDILLEQRDQLREWVLEKGAHIYVCGSKQGFGEAVCQTLAKIIAADCLAQRLHKDLY